MFIKATSTKRWLFIFKVMIEVVRRLDKSVRNNFNTEGLSHLYWELFDSPDSNGSGFMYMEREPVLILDDIIKEHQKYRPVIERGYTSKPIADLLGLPSISPYRVGKGVKLRVTSAPKRMFIVKALILRGVERIAINEKYIEFDTDNYLYKPNLYLR